MATMTLREFCDEKMSAGIKFIEWLGERNLAAMWAECQHGVWMVWLLLEMGWDDAHTQREFAWWCASQVRHLMTDPRNRDCLDVVRRHLDGEASEEELDAAWCEAHVAANAADNAADDAAAYAADAAHAAHAATYATYAAHVAADAAYAADDASADAAQADRLRELVPIATVQELFDAATTRA